MPGTIRSVWAGERPVIRSNGKFTRDYIFIDDVVTGYLTLGERADDADVRGQAFNFSPETRVQVLDITRQIQRLMGRTDLEPLILDHAKAEILDQYLDSGKAKRVLGWTARHSLEDGLRQTIGWYQAYLDTAARRPARA